MIGIDIENEVQGVKRPANGREAENVAAVRKAVIKIENQEIRKNLIKKTRKKKSAAKKSEGFVFWLLWKGRVRA